MQPDRVVSAAFPTGAIPKAFAPLANGERLHHIGCNIDGEVARTLMLHGFEDIPTGLLRHLALWHETGMLCDRSKQRNYLMGMKGCQTPTMVVTAAGDPYCPPSSALPAFEVLGNRRLILLDEEWGHFDPLVGRAANSHVHPSLIGWLDQWRRRCW